MTRLFGNSKIPTSEWLRPSVVALVLANLVPIYGVLFWDWKVFPIILLFCLENLVVGAFNILKMIPVESARCWHWLAKIF